MKIFILLSIIILAISIVLKIILFSAKRNLFKDQGSWSTKDINIRYSKSNEVRESRKNYIYLKTIADESKLYLEDQLNQESE